MEWLLAVAALAAGLAVNEWARRLLRARGASAPARDLAILVVVGFGLLLLALYLVLLARGGS
jgi:hypothetical protein